MNNPYVYTWSDWRSDNDQDMWHLFHTLSAAVENGSIPILDQVVFSDFTKFCFNFTSSPVPREEAHSDTDDEYQEDHEDQASADFMASRKELS